MTNYRRRFTKDEFKKELMEHLGAMPPGHLQAPHKLDSNAERKAELYTQALAALDRAADRIRQMASANPELKPHADDAIREIDDAVDTYGEVSMSGNGSWKDS